MEFSLGDLKSSFLALNLGSRYVKGLFVQKSQILDYIICESNSDYVSLIREKLKSYPQIKKINVSFNSLFGVIRCITIPKVRNKEKLKEVISYELPQHIPFPIEDIYYGYHPLEKETSQDMAVIVGAVKKEVVDEIIAKLDKIGVILDIITLDPVSLINLFLCREENKDGNVCILDLGYSFSTIILFNKNLPVLIRESRMAGKDILKVVEINNPDRKLSEKELCKIDNFWSSSLDILDNIIKDMRDSFEYFEINYAQPIKKIYVTGGMVGIKGFKEILQSRFKNVEVENLYCGDNVHIFDEHNEKEFLINAFSVAYGLI